MSFSISPPDASSLERGDAVVLTFNGAISQLDIFATEEASEVPVYSFVGNVHSPGFVVEIETQGADTIHTIRRAYGWLRSDTLNIRATDNGANNITADYTVTGDKAGFAEPEMVQEALDLLLVQFQGKADIEALLCSYVKQANILRKVAYSVIFARFLDFATGHRLDQLGAIAGIGRAGAQDLEYRRKVQAKFKINASNGTVNEILEIFELLLNLPSNDIALDQHFPESFYIRARDFAYTGDPALVGDLVRLAGASGYDIQFIYTPVENDDNNLFRFAGPGVTSSSGFGNGTFVGAA